MIIYTVWTHPPFQVDYSRPSKGVPIRECWFTLHTIHGQGEALKAMDTADTIAETGESAQVTMLGGSEAERYSKRFGHGKVSDHLIDAFPAMAKVPYLSRPGSLVYQKNGNGQAMAAAAAAELAATGEDELERARRGGKGDLCSNC